MKRILLCLLLSWSLVCFDVTSSSTKAVARKSLRVHQSIGELRTAENTVGLSLSEFNEWVSRARWWKQRPEIGGEPSLRIPGKRVVRHHTAPPRFRARVVPVSPVAAKHGLRLDLTRFTFARLPVKPVNPSLPEAKSTIRLAETPVLPSGMVRSWTPPTEPLETTTEPVSTIAVRMPIAQGSGRVFVYETFKDQVGTDLIRHRSSGVTWTVYTGGTPNTIGADHLVIGSNAPEGYKADLLPGDADQTVSLTFKVLPTGTAVLGVSARQNFIDAGYSLTVDGNTGNWELRSATTLIDSDPMPSFTPGNTHTMTLSCIGTTITGKFDGVTVVSGTNAEHAAAGQVGFFTYGKLAPTKFVASDGTSSAVPNITTYNVPNATKDSAASIQIDAVNGTGALTWSITSGTLPTGLSQNTSTGLITGTPTVAGLSLVTFRVTDSLSVQSAAVTVPIAVEDADNFFVTRAQDLQLTLSRRTTYGGKITLEKGQVWRPAVIGQPFVLGARTGTPAFTTLTSSGTLPNRQVGKNLDANGVVTNTLAADLAEMATIEGIGGSTGCLQNGNDAKWWKIDGIEFTNFSSGTSVEHSHSLLDIGASGTTGASDWYIDRIVCRPQEWGSADYTRTASRCLGLNVDGATITRSFIDGFLGFYQHDFPGPGVIDAVVIASNTARYVDLTDNWLGAGFQMVFLGGGGAYGFSTGVVQASPTPTLTSATLSSTAGLDVGDWIAFPQSFGCGDRPTCYASGQILTKVGNALTFTSLSSGMEGFGVEVPPIVATSGQWEGGEISNWNVLRNDWVFDTTYLQWLKTNFDINPKGYTEVKNCNWCLFKGNIFTGWPSVFAINATNQNSDGPWISVSNTTVENNFFSNFGTALSLSLGSPTGYSCGPNCGGFPTEQSVNLQITDNLLTEQNNLASDAGISKIGVIGRGENVTIQHNTVVNRALTNSYVFSGNGPTTGFTFKDNIWWSIENNLVCAQTALSNCFPSWAVGNNLIVDNSVSKSEAAIEAEVPGSIVVADGANPVLFVGSNPVVLTDWILQATSLGFLTASDGTNIGANIPAIAAALTSVLTCNWHTNPPCQ